ncbi:MAG TPA: pyrroloquinoline quinone precursor peptide PqqA [Candidatus Limnocylindria bacterium]|nr:pyrroloquinoline quinone precursor peptide PqqA [Candidatus Limnocylindria bacterium]
MFLIASAAEHLIARCTETRTRIFLTHLDRTWLEQYDICKGARDGRPKKYLSQFSGGIALENQITTTWNRPEFEEVGSGFEVTAYSNDWDQDRI